MKIKTFLATVTFILLSALAVAATTAEFRIKGYVGELNLVLVNKKTFEVYQKQETVDPDNGRIIFHHLEPGDYVLTAWPDVVYSTGDCFFRTEVQLKDDDWNIVNLAIPSGLLIVTVEELGQKVPRTQPGGASFLVIRRIDENGRQVPGLRWWSSLDRGDTTLSAVINRIGPGEYEAYFMTSDTRFGDLAPVSAGRFVLKENDLKESKPFEVHLQWGKK